MVGCLRHYHFVGYKTCLRRLHKMANDASRDSFSCYRGHYSGDFGDFWYQIFFPPRRNAKALKIPKLNLGPAFFADAGLFVISARGGSAFGGKNLITGSPRFIAGRTNQHDIGKMHRHGHLNNLAFLSLALGTGVFFSDIDSFDNNGISSKKTLSTFPLFPRSFPEITFTLSPFFIFIRPPPLKK